MSVYDDLNQDQKDENDIQDINRELQGSIDGDREGGDAGGSPMNRRSSVRSNRDNNGRAASNSETRKISFFGK